MKAHRQRTSLGGWQKRRLSELVGVLTLTVVYWDPAPALVQPVGDDS